MWLYVPPPSSPSAPDTAGWSSASALLSLEFVVWVLSSGKPSPQRSSQVEWSTVPWIHVLSTTIWNPSMAERTATAWISSLPVSPARAPASPGSASASPTSAGSGRKSGASRKRLTPVGSSGRTSPVSSLLTVGEHSRTSSGTWHRAGGMRSGTAAAVGAPHLRDRVFLLATDASRVGVRVEPERDQRRGRRARAAERGAAESRDRRTHRDDPDTASIGRDEGRSVGADKGRARR